MTHHCHEPVASLFSSRLVALALLLLSARLEASDPAEQPLFDSTSESSAPYLRYDADKGLRYTSPAEQTDLWIGLRFQFRTDSLPGQIRSVSDLQPPPNGATELKRGRVKGGGTLFSEDLEIYSEYNFPTNSLLDYRGTWHITDTFNVRVGQWKSDYNRERIDSSGKQQFVDRSLSNYWFTLDRQMGTSLNFRLNEGESFDSTVWLQYLSGYGLGASYSDDSGLWMVRWQWNPQGEVLGFNQADLDRTEDFISAVTLGAVYGDSRFTRFSSSGGGQLPGYGFGNYRFNQIMFETAAKWRGWSWQQELHWKDIETRGTGTHQSILGGYAQIGTFPSEYCIHLPKPLELVARAAHVTPDVSLSNNAQWEFALGTNWYFNGHRNKISADVSTLNMNSPTGAESEARFRLQWEVSF